MQNFCYKCGRSSEEAGQLINNLCHNCYKETHPLIEFPKIFKIKLCKNCNRYYLKGRWISTQTNDLEKILDTAIKENVPLQIKSVPQVNLKIISHITGNLDNILNRKQGSIDIEAIGTVHEALYDYKETYRERPVKIDLIICPSCLSLKKGAYQAVLHILTPKRNMLEKERDYIYSVINDECERWIQIDSLAYISKIRIKKGKLTFFIGSEKFARSLALLLSFQLGGNVKETYRAGSQKIPKEIKKNKLFISIYLPTFKVGDLLLVKNTLLFITKIKGKRVWGFNLKNHQKFIKPLRIFKNAKIIRQLNDLRSFIYFSQMRDAIHLMDRKNYQIYEIQKVPESIDLPIGGTLKGFEIENQIYLIPENLIPKDL
ncbi:MAG: NMD3-related protein [Candidatus Helarchaeota archaeon]